MKTRIIILLSALVAACSACSKEGPFVFPYNMDGTEWRMNTDGRNFAMTISQAWRSESITMTIREVFGEDNDDSRLLIQYEAYYRYREIWVRGYREYDNETLGWGEFIRLDPYQTGRYVHGTAYVPRTAEDARGSFFEFDEDLFITDDGEAIFVWGWLWWQPE